MKLSMKIVSCLLISSAMAAAPANALTFKKGQVLGADGEVHDGASPEQRGSINYLAIAPEHQRSGLGAELMRRAEAYLIERGCPKVSFCVRKTNEAVLAFYRQLGYEIDDVHFLGKRLISDV